MRRGERVKKNKFHGVRQRMLRVRTSLGRPLGIAACDTSDVLNTCHDLSSGLTESVSRDAIGWGNHERISARLLNEAPGRRSDVGHPDKPSAMAGAKQNETPGQARSASTYARRNGPRSVAVSGEWREDTCSRMYRRQEWKVAYKNVWPSLHV
ncbi:hypothetical protein BC827DRAFT_1156267 [Russula dissimulans]|nr:hypothetical protein BC827DRAFT_1156267 [Russula dissimulans]